MSAPAELTPHEVEVALLVTDGLTNRRIRVGLLISSTTAGVHVSNLLAMTGLDSSFDVAEWARTHDLCPAP